MCLDHHLKFTPLKELLLSKELLEFKELLWYRPLLVVLHLDHLDQLPTSLKVIQAQIPLQ